MEHDNKEVLPYYNANLEVLTRLLFEILILAPENGTMELKTIFDGGKASIARWKVESADGKSENRESLERFLIV